MPELPEVETVVRGVRPKLVGRRIRSVPLASPLMVASPRSFAKRLCGHQVLAMDRVGKWMFVRLSSTDTLVLHLGMTGHLEVTAATAALVPHTHLRLELDDGAEQLRFSDPRRFGEIVLYRPEEWQARFGDDKLGPDALAIKPRQLAQRLAKTRRNLKSALMDQRVVAGVGNIYADEILFAARLAPSARADSLSDDQARTLHRQMGRILRRSIAANGTTIRDYVTSQGAPGEFQSRLMVYGRADLPCKNCSTRIELIRTIVSGRATYWCPRCQKNGSV